VPARLINIKYITIRAEKVASPVTALQLAEVPEKKQKKIILAAFAQCIAFFFVQSIQQKQLTLA